MAGEVQVSFLHNATLYFLVWDRTGRVWNTLSQTFGAYATGTYANYTTSLLELGTASHHYNGTFPTAISAGSYSIEARQQLGGSPSETDPTVGVASDFEWNGTAIFPLADLVTSGQLGQLAPLRLARGVMVKKFPLYLKSSADHITPFTSGVVSGQVSQDGSIFTALQSGAFTEVGLGFYSLQALTSGDLLGDTVSLLFSAQGISGGQADPLPLSFITQRVSGSL